MYCIISDSRDPCFNLALEEILLKKRTEEFIILGINSNSVVIGKHQSAHREINSGFIYEKNIPVIRRISGGGTVFHDPGNLNFTFIIQSESGKQVNFQEYTKPVIDFLLSVGVEAKFEGKNDIKVRGLKISGNAEHVYHNRVLHHGTLLYNASLENLKSCLRKDLSHYSSRAVASNPSSVINLKDILPDFKDIFEFRSAITDYFLESIPDAEVYKLSEDDREEAETLAETKYRTWEWNYGYGPEYLFRNNFVFSGEQVTCQLDIKEGIIRNCILKGSDRLSATSGKLVGCRHMIGDMLDTLKKEGREDLDILNFF